MGKDLKAIYALTEQQLLLIQRYFMSDTSDYVNENVDEWMTDDDSDDSSAGMDTENEAGVADWTDFGSFDVDANDPRPALIRKESKDFKKGAKNSRWLQGSLISAIGNMDLLVFAHAQKIVSIEKNPSDNTFQIIAQFNTADSSWSPPAYIRCLCVFPLSCTRKTETSLYDWSAIAVGMSNGYVRFFTEKGLLLRSDHIADSPIEEIRLGRSMMAGNQELAVLSQTDLTCIEGLSLYVALKTAKSQLAFGEIDIEKVAAHAKLNIEKLKFESGINVVDFGISGPLKATWFDVYSAATLSPQGYKAKVERSSLPIYSTYVFAGRSPYVGFGWHTPGASQNVLSDALYVLGNKLTSSVASSMPSFGIRSFLSMGVSRKDQPIVEIKPSVVIPMRSSIVDGKREGERIYMAPSKYKLAAVTDSLARVTLIDIRTRHMVRMWKGYRDARCAWLEGVSTLDRKKSRYELDLQPSTALFLVIFAPRRGLLEAWSMQNGRRVFASTVDRHGRLIGIPQLNDHLLGCDERTAVHLPSVFFLSSDGTIYHLWIPFHRALSDESDSAIHDSSIIKEINDLVKNGDVENFSTWLRFFRALKTVPAMRESIDILWRNCDIDCYIFSPIMASVLQHVESYHAVKKSPDSHNFVIYIATISQLLDVYVCLLKIDTEQPNTTNEEFEKADIAKKLFIDKEMLNLCLERISKCSTENNSVNEKNLTFVEFISHFDLTQATLAASNQRRLKNKLLKKTPALGNLLFDGVLKERCTIQHFLDHVISQLGLSGNDLADAFCAYWFSSCDDFVHRLPYILILCKHLSEVDSDEQSWLTKVERNILNSQELGPALTLCLVARAVAYTQKHSSPNKINSNDELNDESHHEDWDKVELTLEWWDLLSRHLQCMIVLKALPGSLRVCLSDLISDGPAYYREQIGKWSAGFSLDPEHFYDIFDDPTIVNPKIKWEVTIGELRKLFPISLSPELVICDCAWECIGAWRRHKDKNAAYKLLEKAVNFVELLGEAGILQHGICFMMWNTFLRHPFRYIYDFLNRKSSKFKKLEDCRMDLASEHFPSYCTKILRLLRYSVKYAEAMDGNDDSSSASIDHNLFEDFIEAIFEFQRRKQTKPKKPLSLIAGFQKPVNYPLACHHHDLAMVIELQVALEEWPPGPKYLFDSVGERAFFESFYAHPLIPIESITESVREKRMDFLKKCITHNGSPEFTRNLRFHIYDLANDWMLNADEIKSKEVITLFQKGLDSEARDILKVMENMELLPYELFDVAVARIRKWFDTNEKEDLMMRSLRMSFMNDRMMKCIRESKMEVVLVSPDDINQLMRQVRICLNRVQSNDQAVKINHLAVDFEKLIMMIQKSCF
uniref:Rab3-GAP regulatory subunit N-terminal domain-containing protein n=1 Tax=Onchocerca volvulus TaxID=6282 RepID=A0A8R1TPJ0_ONCVO